RRRPSRVGTHSSSAIIRPPSRDARRSRSASSSPPRPSQQGEHWYLRLSDATGRPAISAFAVGDPRSSVLSQRDRREVRSAGVRRGPAGSADVDGPNYWAQSVRGVSVLSKETPLVKLMLVTFP